MPGTPSDAAIRICLEQISDTIRLAIQYSDHEVTLLLEDTLDKVGDLQLALRHLRAEYSPEAYEEVPKPLESYVPPARRSPGARGGAS